MFFCNTIRIVSCLAIALTLTCAKVNAPAQSSSNTPSDPATVLVQQSIGSAGGTIIVSDTSGKINGLTITVPPGAFDGNRTVSVSVREPDKAITTAQVTRLSPLITITTGGGYTDSSVEVSIPVKVPQNEFAMGYLYNKTTGTLEGLPLVDATDTSVVIASRHFSATAGLGKGAVSLDLTELVVLSLKKTVRGTTISSGFTPGIDDWEFPNYGSIISSGGHCAGQSVSAMWYYYERKPKGGPVLYHAFDNLLPLWSDNNRGYRFASVLQSDLQWEGFMREVLNKVFRDSTAQERTFWAFAAAIYTTHEPQYVSLRSLKGGHAIICYGVDLADTALLVADPNFPGQSRKIKMSQGKFIPYNSKQNANEMDSSSYTRIGYLAKTALIDWPAIGVRYAQFENNTIGSIAPNTFPAYTIFAADTDTVIVHDSLITTHDSVVVFIKSAQCPASMDGDGLQVCTVFDTLGDTLTGVLKARLSGRPDGFPMLKLRPGRQRIGIQVMGCEPIPGSVNKVSFNWLDFRWITVVSMRNGILPDYSEIDKINGNVGLCAIVAGFTSKDLRYEWQFSDTAKIYTKNGDSSMNHQFYKTGSDTVTVTFFKSATNEKLGTARRIYQVIGSPIIDTVMPAIPRNDDTLSIFGHGFSRSGMVLFNTDTLRQGVLFWSDTLVKVIMPDSFTSGWLNVFNSYSHGMGKVIYKAHQPALIKSIEPAGVEPGDSVTFRGRFFKRGGGSNRVPRTTWVLFAGADGSFHDTLPIYLDEKNIWSDSLIQVRVPMKAKSGFVMVKTGDSLCLPVRLTVRRTIADVTNANMSVMSTRFYTNTTTAVVDSAAHDGESINMPPGLFTVQGNTVTAVWDTSYESGSGTYIISMVKHSALTCTVDFDSNQISSFAVTRSEIITRKQDGVVIRFESSYEGGSVQLKNIQTTIVSGDTLLGYQFVADSLDACSHLTKYSSVNESMHRTLTRIECTGRSFLGVGFYMPWRPRH